MNGRATGPQTALVVGSIPDSTLEGSHCPFQIQPSGSSQHMGVWLTCSLFLINGWRKELARNKPVSFRLTPEHGPVTLGDDDVIVHNLSLHITNRNKSYEELVDFGQQLLSHSQRTQQLPGPITLPLPRLVYVSTFTQHFRTDTGIFEESTKKGPGCVASLNSSIRRDVELTILQAGTNVHQILVVDDLDKGGMHIGKDDCTHYCMPGVPDITASRLLKLLAT
mmetsp:Transcript_4507/g.4525  ORF Transcript_4507/g.4525 Transcript_4507/m.4525 type:complete len:223 (-) Transcript_4507:449-1117(-)